MADDAWTPAFDGQRPPFQRGNPGRQVEHGAYSEARLAAVREQIVEQLSSRSPAYAEADDHARWVLANQLARIELVYRWLDENGLVADDGQLRPVVRELTKWEGAARELMRDLGMTTVSRAALHLDLLKLEADRVSLAEVQEAMASTLALAQKYVPREQIPAFLSETRALFGSDPAEPPALGSGRP